MRVLQAEITDADQSLQVRWSVPAEGKVWSPYIISLERARDCTERIRRALDNLQSLPRAPNLSHPPARDALRQLAGEGAELYDTVLTGNVRHQLSRDAASRFRAWFEEEVNDAGPDAWRIEVISLAHAAPPFPWGLIYTPSAGGAPAPDATLENYGGFWCLRHHLACCGVHAEEARTIEERRDGLNVVLGVVVEVGHDTVRRFEERSKNNEVDRARYLPLNRQEFEEAHAQYAGRDLFWYISLRAEGGSFQLYDDTLDAAHIDFGQSELGDDNVMLMMLDGDAVVRNDRGPDWLEAALRAGRSGLIAVETDITNPSLKFFGWELFRYVITQRSPLLTSFQRARSEFWPHSLLYGLYCDPLHIYTEPSPDSLAIIDDFMKICQVRDSANGAMP